LDQGSIGLVIDPRLDRHCLGGEGRRGGGEPTAEGLALGGLAAP